MPQKLRIIIADDHPIFRKGLREVIDGDTGMCVIGEARDGDEAVLAIEHLQPDVAVLAIDMPKKNGLEVVRTLRDHRIDLPLVFLTMEDEEEMFNEAMDEGVRGYVLKESAVRDIIDCIRLVAAGRHYISPSISSYLVVRRGPAKNLRRSFPSLSTLTPTERRILRLIAHGRTSKEIAKMLHMAPKTVDNHRLGISTKLKLHGTHHLLKFAVRNKSFF